MSAGDEILTMKLYNHIERIDNELINIQSTTGKPYTIDDIIPLTCLNYSAAQGCDSAIQAMNIGSNSNVLDIGAGVGGPALYISSKTNCRIVAVELQENMAQKMRDLARYCNLERLVNVVTGDINSVSIAAQSIDVVVSWLAILHIPKNSRLTMFEKLFAWMKPGAKLYFEDYYQLHTFTDDEVRLLREDVYASNLFSQSEYIQALQNAGFIHVHVNDQTEKWKDFAATRRDSYIANKERHIRVHNKETFDSLSYFYTTVAALFAGGNLGGGVIMAEKP